MLHCWSLGYFCNYCVAIFGSECDVLEGKTDHSGAFNHQRERGAVESRLGGVLELFPLQFSARMSGSI